MVIRIRSTLKKAARLSAVTVSPKADRFWPQREMVATSAPSRPTTVTAASQRRRSGGTNSSRNNTTIAVPATTSSGRIAP